MSGNYSVFVCDKCAREKGLEQFTPPPLLSGPCIHCGDETTSTGPNPNYKPRKMTPAEIERKFQDWFMAVSKT